MDLRTRIRVFSFLALLFCFFSITYSASAQENPGDINIAVNFRHPDGAWNKNIRAGQRVLDQMVQNKGPDEVLSNFSWDQLNETASWASANIKCGDELGFRERLDLVEKSMTVLTTQEAKLAKLRKAINIELQTGLAEWDVLLKDADTIEFLGHALGMKGVGFAGRSIFLHLGGKIGENLLGHMMTGAGKALGPITTAIGVHDVYLAASQQVDMQLLSPQLLEMTETVAFLDVLLWNYDQAINAHERIIDALMTENDNYQDGVCKVADDLFPGRLLSAFYPKVIVSGGTKAGIQLTISGEFDYPITAVLQPRSCPFNVKCGTEKRSISAKPNDGRIYVKDVLWCVGVSSPWAMDYEILLEDSSGYVSNSIAVETRCLVR